MATANQIYLFAAGDLGVGNVITGGSGIQVHANSNGVTNDQFLTGSSGSAGGAKSLNASGGSGGVYLLNGGTGGIKIGNAGDINTSNSSGVPGNIIPHAPKTRKTPVAHLL